MADMEKTAFGRYYILETLPQSGSGLVYHASDSDFEGEVAIKILPRLFYTDPARRFKFEQEQRILALLENDHITPILEIGEWESRLFIVMRWMSGGSLADRLANGPLSEEVAVDLFYKIACILRDAHRVGIVHRDIKPENVLFDENGDVFLSDFGMLKLAEVSPQGAGGYLVGATAFASPEEAYGERDIDERSDVYAMGILLYQMLSRQDLPRSSNFPLNLAGFSALFSDAIQQATRRNRELRFTSIEKMLQALYELPEDEFDNSSQSSSVTEEKLRPHHTSRLKYVLAPFFVLMLLISTWLAYTGEWQKIYEMAGNIPAMAALLRQSPIEDFLPGATAVPTIKGPPTATMAMYTPTEMIPTIEQTIGAVIVAEDQNTLTVTPTSSPTITPSTPTPFPITIGGASQLAFLHEYDIWLINLNGTGLERLTTDGIEKTQMRWTADGKYLLFQTEGFYKLFDPQTSTYLELGRVADLDISADLSRVVVGDMVVHDRQIKKWMNAFVDVDLSNVKPVTMRRNMDCKFYAGRLSRFSADGTRMTSMITVSQNDMQYEVIGVYKMSDCEQEPTLEAFFLGNDFLIRGYSGARGTRKMDDYTWDGGSRFVFNGQVLSGYGDLYYYDLETRSYSPLTPMGSCCYRYARWSPDGTYLLFAYVDTKLSNQVRVYYRPWEEVLSNASSGDMSEEFLPLPVYMFEDRSKDFQLALRPGN